MNEKSRDSFRDFLKKESERVSVKFEGSKISWNYEEVEDLERPPRYLESPFLEQAASEPVILTTRELSTIKEHIKLLDAEVLRLRRLNRVMKILCIILLVLLITLIVAGNSGGLAF